MTPGELDRYGDSASFWEDMDWRWIEGEMRLLRFGAQHADFGRHDGAFTEEGLLEAVAHLGNLSHSTLYLSSGSHERGQKLTMDGTQNDTPASPQSSMPWWMTVPRCWSPAIM